jgi:hypothetical protein
LLPAVHPPAAADLNSNFPPLAVGHGWLETQSEKRQVWLNNWIATHVCN